MNKDNSQVLLFISCLLCLPITAIPFFLAFTIKTEEALAFIFYSWIGIIPVWMLSIILYLSLTSIVKVPRLPFGKILSISSIIASSSFWGYYAMQLLKGILGVFSTLLG